MYYKILVTSILLKNLLKYLIIKFNWKKQGKVEGTSMKKYFLLRKEHEKNNKVANSYALKKTF